MFATFLKRCFVYLVVSENLSGILHKEYQTTWIYTIKYFYIGLLVVFINYCPTFLRIMGKINRSYLPAALANFLVFNFKASAYAFVRQSKLFLLLFKYFYKIYGPFITCKKTDLISWKLNDCVRFKSLSRPLIQKDRFLFHCKRLLQFTSKKCYKHGFLRSSLHYTDWVKSNIE